MTCQYRRQKLCLSENGRCEEHCCRVFSTCTCECVRIIYELQVRAKCNNCTWDSNSRLNTCRITMTMAGRGHRLHMFAQESLSRSNLLYKIEIALKKLTKIVANTPREQSEHDSAIERKRTLKSWLFFDVSTAEFTKNIH